MKMNMKDFEQHLLAHHSGHVHPEPGTTTSSGSSRRRLQSASRHFSFRQPCLSASVPPVCSYWTMLQFTRTHLPMEVAGTFFWQPVKGVADWGAKLNDDLGGVFVTSFGEGAQHVAPALPENS